MLGLAVCSARFDILNEFVYVVFGLICLVFDCDCFRFGFGFWRFDLELSLLFFVIFWCIDGVCDLLTRLV